jgi:hypothetical protein
MRDGRELSLWPNAHRTFTPVKAGYFGIRASVCRRRMHCAPSRPQLACGHPRSTSRESMSRNPQSARTSTASKRHAVSGASGDANARRYSKSGTPGAVIDEISVGTEHLRDAANRRAAARPKARRPRRAYLWIDS